nr:phosphatidylglycerol lysyltransferase domain-containing protein [uncultured Mediterraneibacter sp.]
MLDFRRIEMSDFPAIRKMYEKYGNWSCDCTICGTYMWRDYLDIRISLDEEKLIVYQQLDGKHLFYIPLMEDRIKGMKEIVAYMKEQGEDCYFYPAANEEMHLFEEAGYEIETERDEGWNDYVYDITALANMRGKKYHNHKNHINKFNALYENVELLDIRDVEPEEYLQFLDDYVKSEHKKATIAKEENVKAKEVLSDLDAYGVIGYVLKVDGKIAGLEVGEILGEYYYSHIEKADKSYNGVYSKLVQLVSQDLQEKVKYMNREEDLNEPGLRRSKRGYKPIGYIEKNQVLIKGTLQ